MHRKSTKYASNRWRIKTVYRFMIEGKKDQDFLWAAPNSTPIRFFMYLENTISLLIVDLYGCSQAIGYASSFDRFSNSNDVSDIHKRIVKMRWELRLWKAVINRHIETLNRINFICISEFHRCTLINHILRLWQHKSLAHTHTECDT